MNSPLHLLVVDGKTITKTASLPQTANGQPVHIKAIDGGKYLLSSGENQAAPDHIVVKRVGKDLQVFTQEGDDTPEIIIDGFYDHQGELSGMAADSTYHTYVNQDGSDRDAFLLLDDSGASTLVLGSESTGGLEGLAAAGGLSTGMIALGALAALAALTGIAIAASNRGGHHDSGNHTPSAPDAITATDNIGTVQGKIPANGSTDDTHPVFAGSGTPNSTVNVYDHNQLIGSAQVADNGSWAFTPTTALAEGPHSVSFSQVNADGIEGPKTAPVEFTVDTTAPAAADDLSLTDGKGLDLTHGGLTNDGDVRMSGDGATPGDVVKLYDGDKLIGSAIVDPEGNWTVPGTIVGDGKHDLSVGITDPAGNEGPRSPAIPVDLDTTAPIVPTPTLTDGTGLDLSHGGVTNNGSLDMSGTGGTEGDIVKLYDGDTLVGSTTVGKDGNWTIPGAIGEGTHDLSASYTDPAGNESAKSAPIAVEIDTTPPAAPTPHLEDGNHLDLTAGGPTNNGSLEMSGTGTAGDIVKLYDGDTLIGSDTVGPDGTWTVTGPISGDGIHPISANFTDPAGNVGEKSAPIAVDLDTVAPAAPTPHLEDGNDQDLTTGGLTNNGNLDMSGTGGTKGDIVKLYDGDTLIGSAVVGDGGVWTVPGAISGDGTHPISASFTDPAGNESLKSAPIAVDLDTTAPAAPATPTLEDGNDLDLTAGGVTNNGNLDMSGTGGIEGDIVKLYDGDTLIGSVRVGPGGAWTVPGAISGDGTHPISASFTDPAGNESAKSTPVEVVLDTAPPAPVIPSWDGSNIDVALGSDVVAGDKVVITIDGTAHEIEVSDADIARGYSQLAWSSATEGNPTTIDAAVVDKAGNSSATTTLEKVADNTLEEDFSTQTQHNLAAGEEVAFTGFNFTVDAIDTSAYYKTRFGNTNQGGVTLPPTTMALEIAGATQFTFEMTGTQSYNHISFFVSDLDSIVNMDTLTLEFFDASGNLVHSQVVQAPPNTSMSQVVGFDLPYGESFSKMTLSTKSGGYVWIDDLTFSSDAYQVVPATSGIASVESHDDALQHLDHSLILSSDAGAIDLSHITEQHKSGEDTTPVHSINMESHGDTTLNINIDDVLTLGNKDLFIEDGNKQLMIKGDAGDTVNLETVNGDKAAEQWNAQGEVTMDGTTYNVYQNSDHEVDVLIQQGVQVHQQ
ncbi:hypothetical protein D0N50_13085 [Erwinia billingiae]|uniref:Ig-like domain-containing protein n=1 Tax=Erwinia billingiae TaxID=182337 RepID=UPI0012492AF4|nr:Ig-like domain-containing protein [Erwinia billingiae]QEW32561.1 hypothetical protein D0N50_13085 [Erwinia billingiae]